VKIAVNYFAPIVNTTNGNSAWYLFSDPNNGRPALQQSFLRGHESPELFMKLPNSVQIGDNTSVQVNLPGSQIFSNSSANVLGSLSSLVTALQSGNTAAIGTATNAVSAALNYVSQQRVVYGNAETQLTSQESYLQQETVNLASQATSLVGVDMANAATTLSQAETDNNAALAAAAKVLPNTLLNYLAPPA